MHVDLNSLAANFKNTEFFLVCLYPKSPVVFEGDSLNSLDIQSGDNYWSVTSCALQKEQKLVSPTSAGMVLFRGYDADLKIHSYSETSAKEKIASPENLKNGVFAYIRVGIDGNSILVKSDPLGVAPFYYRSLPGGGYMFASHPPLLYLEKDKVNLMGWMSMIQQGFFYGDQSFYKEIHRIPAGIEFTVHPEKLEKKVWFDISALPTGEKKIEDESFQIVENAYATAMEKLLLLEESRILPFSSGYDSRRFFATMVEKKIAFKAVTCQTFHRKKGKDYDIDSFFAPKIAASFGIDCEIISASAPEQYMTDSCRRLSLIGTESFAHGWAVPLMDWLTKQPISVVFDGLAGDTLGNSGYEFDGLHKDVVSDINILMKETVDVKKFDHFSDFFPNSKEFKCDYQKHLECYPNNLNGIEFAFLQGRTRRGISPWITMMHPPGQVVVFPYCDVNFVSATLQYHPAEKYKWFFQKECLKRSYPAYFDFPGSRNMPAELSPVSKELSDAMDRHVHKFVYEDKSAVLCALKYLNFSNKILMLLSVFFHPLRSRRNWLFVPLLLLVKTQKLQYAYTKFFK